MTHPTSGDQVFSRIPESLRICLNANARQRALNSAGCEVRFRMDGEKAVIRFRSVENLAVFHGGGCHCEPEMADYLAGRKDWDVAVLETGINMLGLDREETDGRIVHLIRTMAGAHQDKPIFCVGVFPCAEDIASSFMGRAREIHELVRRTVAEIDSPTLRFIDGAKAMRPGRGMTTDLTHPSPAGMIEIGQYIAAKAIAALRAS